MNPDKNTSGLELKSIGTSSPGQTITVYTIGHSNLSFEVFFALLAQHRIEVVVDVRSNPYSRFAPHFNLSPLRDALTGRDLGYLFLGDRLGGKPRDRKFYDEAGHVLYDRLAAAPGFQEGIDRIIAGADRRQALLCAEEDPAKCHRHLLIGRILTDRGVELIHIRKDGSLEAEYELVRKEQDSSGSKQMDLFK